MKKFLIVFGVLILALSLNFTSQSRPEEKQCKDCHNALMTGEVIHAAANSDCLNCHKSTGKEHPLKDVKGFELKAEMPQLCTDCHEETKDDLAKKNQHPPFSKNCLICHNPHASNQTYLLKDTAQNLCYGCHDDIAESNNTAAFKHAPLKGDKSCMACHSPHASDESKLLLAGGKDLCLKCHNKSEDKEGHKLVNMAELMQNSKTIHPVIEGDGCTACHMPHAANNARLLNAAYATDKYIVATKDTFALCFKCHDSQILEVAQSTTVTSFRDGDKNLHYVHLNGPKGRNCENCHNVHASPNEHLIVDKVAFGNWDMPMKYKVNENGGSCAPGCHAEKAYKR